MVGRFSGGGFEAGSRKLGYHFRDRLLSALMLDSFSRDWKFESVSLQRWVMCEPDFLGAWAG